MPKCESCGEHYRLTAFNNSETCDNCFATGDFYEEVDAATEIDINHLKNPTGRTLPRFSEVDLEDDSHGF